MAANPIPNPELTVTVFPTDVGVEVRCSGRLTSSTVGQLTGEVHPLLSAGINVNLDLTDVNYMDSSGLGALVRLYVSAKSRKCKFRVEKLNARLKELFSLTRLGEVLTEGKDPDYLVLP
ncbi:MAG TPA: STAS domain-containing protein [Terriglobales bacterium]